MTVETTRLSGEHSGINMKKVARVGKSALLAIALASSAIIMPTYAAKKNLWVAQVQPIDSNIKAFKIANLNGPSGQQLKLNIRIPKSRMVPGASLTFYGLPDKIILSSGVRKSKVWIVPVKSSSKLTLIAPSGFTGHFESAAILRRANGQVIEGQRFVISIQNTKVARKAPARKKAAASEKKNEDKSASKKAYSALSVRPADKVKPKQKQKTAPKEDKLPVVKSPPVQNTINPELVTALLKKGKQLLKDGNIVAARETLKFLAEQGNAESAHLIAKTYDPEEFKNFNATGIEPDLEQAKKWYTIAAKLGAKGAKNRLKEYADAGL